MKLYRLVHRNNIYLLKENPVFGCQFYKQRPCFYAFGSVACTIIESPVYGSLGKIPSSLVILEYEIPEYIVWTVGYQAYPVYQGKNNGNTELSTWVDEFLKSNIAPVAKFPSRYWNGESNYIINPKHPQYQRIRFTDIGSPCIL